jgi:hypothetical protein
MRGFSFENFLSVVERGMLKILQACEIMATCYVTIFLSILEFAIAVAWITVTVLWLGPQHSRLPTWTLSTSSSCSSSSNSNTGSSSASPSAFQVVAPDTPDRQTTQVLVAHWAT